MKVGMIGLGMVAQTHVRALHDAEGLQLAHVVARDADRVARFADEVARETGARPDAGTELDALAARDDIDFVIVCTPPDARADIVDALIAGRKPILMEKPIERTLAAATDLVTRCEAAALPLGILLQQRMRAPVQQLRAQLADARFGAIGAVEIRVPWWREQSYYDEPGRGSYARDGGGVLISQAIHTLDVALQLAGPVTQVQAMARTTALHAMEAEDHVSAGLSFASGAVGSLLATTAAYPGGPESIVLHGELASVRLESERVDIAWHDGRRERAGEVAGSGGGADPMAFTHAWHQAVIEDFAAAVQTGRAPAITGRSALAVHRLIDALTRSSQLGRLVDVAVAEP